MIQCNLLLVLSRMTTIEALSGYRKLTDKKRPLVHNGCQIL